MSCWVGFNSITRPNQLRFDTSRTRPYHIQISSRRCSAATSYHEDGSRPSQRLGSELGLFLVMLRRFPWKTLT